MARVGPKPRRASPRLSVLTALAGAISGLMLCSLILAQGAFTGHQGATVGAPRTPPGLVDPEFLPDVLTSPNATASGRFGTSLALSGSTLVVGAPSESVYVGGYSYDGLAYLVNTVTGATTVLTPPSVGAFGSDFGGAVAVGGGRVVVGAADQNDSEGAAYVFSASTGARLLELKSPNGQSGLGYGTPGFFGSSVAVQGNLVVVAADDENASGVAEAGHVYVFNTQTGTVMMLQSPSPQVAGFFGSSVAISGNYIAVGAESEEALGTTLVDSGNVYVFSATTGDLLENFSSPNAQTGGFFGCSVALNGSWLAVGAAGETSESWSLAGNAYLFNIQTATSVTYTSPLAVNGGEFGFSVALSSSSLVVGAPTELSNGSGTAGNAYLFGLSGGDSVLSILQPPGWPQGGHFGLSVADNGSAVAVGAPQENASGWYGAGHAFVFTKIPVTYSSENPQAAGDFGLSVSVINNMVAVGAPDETVGSDALSGRVYLSSTLTGPITTYANPNPQTGGDFGTAVALSPSYLVVGAPGEYGGEGAVSVFNVSTGALHESLGIAHVGGLGGSVAISGNLVAMGETNLSLGSGVSAVPDVGGVLVFNMSNGSFLNLPVPTVAPGEDFGCSVSLSGSTLVVGAAGNNSYNGAAYVFDALNGKLLHSMRNPDPGPGLFGYSVSVSGNVMVVGAPDESPGVFVYSASTGALEHTLTTGTSTENDGGVSVATNGAEIVVGAPREDAFGVPWGGDVYIFAVTSGALLDRYNAPEPSSDAFFGWSVDIGPGGTIVVGDAPAVVDASTTNPGNAFAFFV